MASPNSRAELITYCKRQLGEPVLQVNIDDEQVNNVIDDTYQFFQENCYNGMERAYLFHEITADDKTRFAASVTTSSGTTDWKETTNYIPVPDHVVGITRVFGLVSNSIRSNLFGVEYQLFLNDLYYFNSVELLQYSMVKSYLEDIDHLLTTDKQVRFNKRQNRLYLDIDWASQTPDQYIVIDCYRILDPDTFTGVYNDSFLKKYLTALIKRQWGANMIKFSGTRLPGGIELNGRQYYEDGERELEQIKQSMSMEYELPPLDFIG